MNPWETEQNFIQDVGNLENFLIFLDRNNITNSQELLINEENDNVNLLRSLNDLSKIHFEQLTLLETLYDRYRYELILSNKKHEVLCDKIIYLIEIFKKLQSSETKIANLLHNTQISGENIIKIKHSKKHDFLRMIKAVCLLNNKQDFEYISLSSEIHPEMINKITKKYDDLSNELSMVIDEFEECENLKIK
jgi:hypothetical protein